MKKNYVTPEIEITKFQTEDIMAESSTGFLANFLNVGGTDKYAGDPIAQMNADFLDSVND